MDKKIFVFGFPAWEGNYTKSTLELVKELSYEHEVTYIDYGYTILDLLRGVFNKFPAGKRILRGKPFIPIKDRKLKVYNLPALIPYNWCRNPKLLRILLKINYNLIRVRLKRIRKEEGRDAAVWINAFNPFFARCTQKLFHTDSHWYYGYDDISKAPWINENAQNYEFDFLRTCDGAFASSATLLQKFKKHNYNSHLIENGVDLSIFEQWPIPLTDRQTLGYIGSIDERLDWDLLTFLFRSRPQWDFVFIGRVMNAKLLQILEQFDNVQHLPAMAPEALAKEAAAFHVGLIPFVKNSFTKSIYPLKINEYLAMGLPVVSTHFTTLRTFENQISIAENQVQFQEQIEKEILSDSECKRTTRRSFAQNNSWTRRALEMQKQLMLTIHREKLPKI